MFNASKIYFKTIGALFGRNRVLLPENCTKAPGEPLELHFRISIFSAVPVIVRNADIELILVSNTDDYESLCLMGLRTPEANILLKMFVSELNSGARLYLDFRGSSCHRQEC